MATSPNTIVSYPDAAQPLDGTEAFAAWQNGGQKQVLGFQLAQFLLQGIGTPTDTSAAAAGLSAIIAQVSASLAGAAAAIQNVLGTAVAGGGALPFEVTAIAGGIGTGSGGAAGEYALGVTGGPTGHQAFVTIGSDGKIASYRNANPGLATSNAAPTYSLAGVPGLTGGTAPTATVATIPAQRIFFAPETDGSMKLLAWGNNAGALASAPFGGLQLTTLGPANDADMAAGTSPYVAVTPEGLSNLGLTPSAISTLLQGEAIPLFADDPLYGNELIADESGNAFLAVRNTSGDPDNISVFADDPLYGYTLLLDYAGSAFVASAPYVPPGVTINYTDYTASVLADGKVWLYSQASRVALSTPLVAAFDPQLRSDIVRWVDGTDFRRMDLNGFAGIDLTGITAVEFYPMTGQSLAVGAGAAPAISTIAPAPGRVLAFGGRAYPQQDSGIGVNGTDAFAYNAIEDTQLAPLANLVERTVTGSPSSSAFGETQGGGFAAGIAVAPNARSGSTLMVFGTFGVAGADITQINRGTVPYQNMLRAVERLKAWCTLKGLAFTVPASLFDQGEQSISTGMSVADRQTYVTALQANFTTDVQAIIGGAAQVPLIFWQTSATAHYGVNLCDLVAADLALAKATPTKFGCIGPQYWSTQYRPTDGIHQFALGYRMFGELMARQAKSFLASGSTGALFLTGASNAGTVLTITTNAATQLVIDTTVVSDPGQYGLVLIDTTTGAQITLSGIAVSGSSTITATAGSALVSGRTYKVGAAYYLDASGHPNAGPTTGHRAPFRDSAPETFSALAGGARMFNYLCHDAVTFVAA